MPLPKNNTSRPVGTTTVGIDKTGKHYMYVVGKRGRQPLNLSPQQKQAVAAAGARPGGGAVPMPAGINAQSQAGQASYQRGLKADKQSANDYKALEAKQQIIASHAKWMSSGDGNTKKRLKHLLDNGRGDWLRSGNSEAHKALAGAIVATILGKHLNAVSGGKAKRFTVSFNPGSDTARGHLTLKSLDGRELKKINFSKVENINDGHIENIRSHVRSGIAGTPRPKQKTHKSARHEHQAMVAALSVEPKGETKPKKAKPKKEKLTGGKGDNKPDSAFDKKDLSKGVKVESEHTDDPAKQKEIAKDHLTEDKKYYDKLAKMEGETPKKAVESPKVIQTPPTAKPKAEKKPTKPGKGGVIKGKKISDVATQIAMGGARLHPLAQAIRETHKADIQKMSPAAHHKFIKMYNEHLSTGGTHDEAVKKVRDAADRILKK